MRKRVCYIHVGAHKTGTTSIQWFLQENRPELLESGYFVQEGETKRGYLGKKGLADAGYCGLTTTFARLMFFFQAEDGIRDLTVTGVQTCALPISAAGGIPRRWCPARCPRRPGQRRGG